VGILVIVLFGGLLHAETMINLDPGAEIHRRRRFPATAQCDGL
jgi:hypothetical protein